MIKKVFILMLSMLFLMYVIPIPTFAFGPSDEKIYQGIDVSGYQGDVDYQKVKEDGIEIVYIKSSEGFSYIDSRFERNYAKAKENGLKIGFYHYVTARTEEEARRQAQFFVSVIGKKTVDCKLAMDFENFGSLAREEVNKIGIAFIQKVEELSKKQAIVYSNAYAASNIWNGEITKYPLWIAQYEVSKPQNNGTWESWAGWQYTDEGKVNGIANYVDRNRFTKEVFLEDTTQIPEMPKPEHTKKPLTITINWGDTLSNLALKYETTVEEIANLNDIENPNLIYAGDSLIIPGKEIEVETEDTQIYIVQKGDTLAKIAIAFQTSIEQIVKDNQIKNRNYIYVGQRLTIRTKCHYDCGHKLYMVQKGDTLWKIAQRNNTTIANIVRLNRIQNRNVIRSGQMLRIR